MQNQPPSQLFFFFFEKKPPSQLSGNAGIGRFREPGPRLHPRVQSRELGLLFRLCQLAFPPHFPRRSLLWCDAASPRRCQAIGDLLAVARGCPPDLAVIASRGLRRHVHHLRARRPGVHGRPHDPACEQAQTRVLCPCRWGRPGRGRSVGPCA